MKSFGVFALALAAGSVSAQPRHPAANHHALHDRRHAALEKRDTVIFTELVVLTECVTASVTSYVTDGQAVTTIAPPSVNTDPQTRIIGSTRINDAVSGGVFHELPASSTSTPPPPPPPATTPSAAPLPPATTPSVAPAPSASFTTGSAPPASPTSALTSGGDGGGNLYGLAMPPSKVNWISACSGAAAACSGIATWYSGLTDEMCCGYDGMAGKDDSRRIIAIPASLMGASSNANAPGLPNQPVNGNCGRMVKVTLKSTGQSTTVQTVDKCPGCQGQYGIDLSPAAFAALGVHPDAGTAEVDWYFM